MVITKELNTLKNQFCLPFMLDEVLFTGDYFILRALDAL